MPVPKMEIKNAPADGKVADKGAAGNQMLKMPRGAKQFSDRALEKGIIENPTANKSQQAAKQFPNRMPQNGNGETQPPAKTLNVAKQFPGKMTQNGNGETHSAAKNQEAAKEFPNKMAENEIGKIAANVGKMLRGAKQSPRSKMAAAAPHKILGDTPANFLYKPSTLSFWGNDVNGDCVTAEEAFAKACYNPEIFIPQQVAIDGAQARGWLNGTYLSEVLEKMVTDGFQVNGVTYDDGQALSIDWTNVAVLQNAISVAPVKIGVGAGQLDIAYHYNGVSATLCGWFATGFSGAKEHGEDHCVTLCGYGTLS